MLVVGLNLEIPMNADIALLKEILACFSTDQAEAWAVAAAPSITSSLPHLASGQWASQEGFAEALLSLRDVLDSFDPVNPEAKAFELCDGLTGVLDFIDDEP